MIKPISYIFSVLIILLYLFNIAIAEDKTDNAVAFVDNNAKRVINILENTPNNTKTSVLTSLFLEITDYEWMGKFVIGKYWASLSSTEQKRYQEVYKNYLISIYVPKYTEYNKNSYKIINTTVLDKDQYVVNMSILSSSNSSINVSYRVKDFGTSFKIRDIIAEDISLITTQRSDFTSFLSSKSIDDLIKNLEQKGTLQS